MADFDLPADALVLGLARSGQAAALALARRGVAVTAADRDEELDTGRLRAAGVEVRLGADDPALVDGMDLLVKSPGVPAEAPLVAAAREHAVPVWSEVELGYRLLGNGAQEVGDVADRLLGQLRDDGRVDLQELVPSGLERRHTVRREQPVRRLVVTDREHLLVLEVRHGSSLAFDPWPDENRGVEPRWPSVRCVVDAAEAELAADALWSSGATGIEERDRESGPVELWAGFPTEAAAHAAVVTLDGRWPAVVDVVTGDEWMDAWREDFEAFAVGRVVVVPAWRSTGGDRRAARPRTGLRDGRPSVDRIGARGAAGPVARRGRRPRCRLRQWRVVGGGRVCSAPGEWWRSTSTTRP